MSKYELKKRKDKPNWYIVWTENRQTHRRSTGTEDRREAELVLASFLLQINKKASDVSNDVLIIDVLDQYYDKYACNVSSEPTVRYSIKLWKDFFGYTKVSEINFDLTDQYILTRQNKDIKHGTISRELSVLKAALNRAVRYGLIKSAPAISSLSSSPPKERYLTRDEAAKLLFAAHDLYLRLFIRLALYTGARSGAILKLTWDRVDFKNKLIFYSLPDEIEKNKKKSVVPIEGALLRSLKFARAHASTNYVIERMGSPINNIKKSFKSACLKAGLNDVSPHTLRHTCATWMAQNGVPIFDISGMLGQRVTATTERYAKHQPEYLRKAAWATLRNREPYASPEEKVRKVYVSK
ncbi:MAG: site-specific integrase [Alphaproteobacteria bacterium]|nr:site-specific integrase [Alphaproteobacteria bacterium]